MKLDMNFYGIMTILTIIINSFFYYYEMIDLMWLMQLPLLYFFSKFIIKSEKEKEVKK